MELASTRLTGRTFNVYDGKRTPSLEVLLLSQRRIADLAAYCLAYEFEDTIASVVEAHRVERYRYGGARIRKARL